MDRDRMIKESLMYWCFLEGLDTNNMEIMGILMSYFKNLSDNELKGCWEVNSEMTRIRINKIAEECHDKGYI